MPIRQVTAGTSSTELQKCYCIHDGITMLGRKIYVAQDQKTKLCWDRPGSRSNPYQLWTATDLKNVAKDPAGHYLMMQDITIPTDGEEYLPLVWEVPFTGVFDGQGHKLKTKSMNTLTVNMQGKTVKDTDPGSTYGRSLSCGLFGINMGIITRIDLTELPLFFSYKTDRFGVVVGSNRGIIDQIKSRSIYRLCNERTHNSGGIVATNTGTIQFCINDNGAYSTSYFMGCAGGMAWQNNGLIENCGVSQNTPANGVTGNYGCISYSATADSVIQDCSFTAKVSGAKAVFDNGSGGGGEQINVKNVANSTFFPRVNFETIIY